MMTITRRGVLELAGAAGVGAVFGSLPGAAAGDEKGGPPPKEEFFVVGPYALGDLFRDMKKEDKDFGDWVAQAELVKFFNGCHFYVIDKRVPRAQGWSFAEDKDWDPKVVIEGKQFKELNKDKDHELTAQIVEVKQMARSLITDLTTSPPHRSLIVTLMVRLAREGLEARTAISWNLNLGRVAYNAGGTKGRP
jgi:sulfur relay (sulfurtransferase) DsrC/TusE family protein